jgi:hypothetical protein
MLQVYTGVKRVQSVLYGVNGSGVLLACALVCILPQPPCFSSIVQGNASDADEAACFSHMHVGMRTNRGHFGIRRNRTCFSLFHNE